MTHLEQMRDLLIEFGQEFEEYQRGEEGRGTSSEIGQGSHRHVIEIDIGHSYAVDFEFNPDGSYVGCDLAV